MRNYRRDLASEGRIDYGRELTLALEQVDATRPLAAAMGAAQAELEEAAMVRADAEVGLARERVKLRFAEHALEGAIRTLHRRAGVADGGRQGPIVDALFPDGLVAETVPVGERQEKRAIALLGRLERLTGGDALRAEAMGELATAVRGFTGARAAFEQARATHAARFAAEVQVRDAHRLQVERVFGQLRTLYPDDAPRRALFVPTAPRVRVVDGEEDVGATGT